MNNPRFDPPSNDPQAIRSEIDSTRQRMDEKIDAIGERLKGRHLIDEVIGFFRSKNGDGEMPGAKLKEKLTQSTGAAMHSVVDSVKAHPLPTLLIGAGVAWLIYESSRKKERVPFDPELADYDTNINYDPDSGDAPLGYSTEDLNQAQGFKENTHSPFNAMEGQDSFPSMSSGGVKEGLSQKASELKARAQEKASQVTQRIQQGTQAARRRAGEIGVRVQQRARQAYNQGRTVVDHHPVEVGLGLLALGVLAGLAIPTPQKVNQFAGPTADRLRQRARQTSQEFMQRGKHVAQAAVSAVKDEARAQGLTTEALRDKATSVVEHGRQAAVETAREEGIAPSQPGTPGPTA